MKKILLLSLLASVTCLYSCKKNAIDKDNKKYIVGTWAPQTERDRVYTYPDGTFVKDTTLTVLRDSANYSYQTYTGDGKMRVTNAKSGTVTSSYTYEIKVSQLILYINGDKNKPVYTTILGSSATNLGLETQFSSKPDASTGLDPNTVYTFLVDTYYTKK